jgi:hypothetical protein
MNLSHEERLNEIALEVNKGWSNSDDVWSFDVDDMKFLLNQAYETKQLREALQRACNSLGADIEDYL